MPVNKQILLGNLGKDPEIKVLQDGSKICKFSLATTEKWNGEKKTEWHNIVAFGKVAELFEQYLTKGNAVYLEGRTQHRTYEKNDGTMGYSTEVVVRDFSFVGGGSGERREEKWVPPHTQKARDDAAKMANVGKGQEDIPF